MRRENLTDAERFTLQYDHAALTDNLTAMLYKVPAGRKLRIDRVLYINATGLAEDTTNAFALEVKSGTADLAIQGEADDELFTAADHGLATGDGPFRLTGTLPTGTSLHTDYWIIRNSANKFYLATSRADALAGTNVSISTDGSDVFLVRNLICRVFNTDSNLTPDIGASLAAGQLEKTADSDVMHRVLDAADTVSVVFTETGTATLPAGRVVLDVRLF